ncbi:uncharacterized protein LOC144706985 [Wolffia australiana]
MAMAMAMATTRTGAAMAVGALRRGPFSFLRSLSASSAAPSPPNVALGASEATAEKKPKRKKKKNLFEVAQFLPDWGIGYNLAKNHWQGISYKITKINLYKDGRHGKAWGIFYKDGLPAAEAPKKISGVHKRGWRYIPESKKMKVGTLTNGGEQSSAA